MNSRIRIVAVIFSTMLIFHQQVIADDLLPPTTPPSSCSTFSMDCEPTTHVELSGSGQNQSVSTLKFDIRTNPISIPGSPATGGSPAASVSAGPRVVKPLTEGARATVRCASPNTIASANIRPDTLAFCAGDPLLLTLEVQQGRFVPISAICMSAAICQAPPNTDPEAWPCQPQVTATGIVFNCPGLFINGQRWTGTASVSSECPVNEVVRSVYPRALVGVDTQFALNEQQWGSGGQGGSWATALTPPVPEDSDGNPTIENMLGHVTLGLRSQRLEENQPWFEVRAEAPLWRFESGAVAGARPAKQRGPLASYRWETASYGQPARGRAYDLLRGKPAERWDLPAWRVGIESYCGHEWSLRYAISVRRHEKDGDCYFVGWEPNGQTQSRPNSDRFDCASGWIANSRDMLRWDWHTRGWTGVNNRLAGGDVNGLPYSTLELARGIGKVDGVQYSDPASDALWIPVIEAQAVLRSAACAASVGACPKFTP